MYSLHKKFLERAGATVLPADDGTFQVEISPLLTYAGEGLESFNGLTLRCPIVIKDDADMEKLVREAKKARH